MRIDFDSFIAERTRDFSPRPWIFRRIAEWLSDPAAPRFFLITGEPGSGKTAIIARLCELSSGTASDEDEAAPRLTGSITAHHFCVAQDSHWLDPVRFSESISTQIADRVPRFRATVLAQLREQRPMEIHAHIDVAQNWGNVIAVNVSAALTAGEAFSRVVRTPLEATYAATFDRPIVIAVDALDEARHASGATNIFHLVARTRYLPPQVRFILTSRPVSEILRELKQQEPRLLHVSLGDPLTRAETFADVRRYVERVVTARPELVTRRAPQLTADALIGRICRKSDGNFLWARYALLTLQSGGADVDDAAVSALPLGLDRLYVEFLHRVVEGSRSRWRDELGPILGLLAVSQDELTEDEIALLTSLPRDAVAQDLLLVSELLETTPGADGNRYRIFHRSFIDFLLTPSTAHAYWCDAAVQHRRVVTRWREHDFPDASSYELRNIARHLFELHDDDAARDLDALVSRQWMEFKRSRLGSDASFFTDVELALESARRRRPAAVAKEVKASLVLATLGSRGERFGTLVIILMTRLGRLDDALQQIKIMPLPLRSQARGAVSHALLMMGETDRALEMAREALSTAATEYERQDARSSLVAALTKAGRVDEAFALSHQLYFRASNTLGDLRDRALAQARLDIAVPLTEELTKDRDAGRAEIVAALDACDPAAAADMVRSIESREQRVSALAGAMKRGEVLDVIERYKDVVNAEEINDAMESAAVTTARDGDLARAVSIADVSGESTVSKAHLAYARHLALKDLEEMARFGESRVADSAAAFAEAAKTLVAYGNLGRAVALMQKISSPEMRRRVRREVLDAFPERPLDWGPLIDAAESEEERQELAARVFDAAVRRGDTATALRYRSGITPRRLLLWVRLLLAAGDREAALIESDQVFDAQRLVIESFARAGDVDTASALASDIDGSRRSLADACMYFGAAVHSAGALAGLAEAFPIESEIARLLVLRPESARMALRNLGEAGPLRHIGKLIAGIVRELFRLGAYEMGKALLAATPDSAINRTNPTDFQEWNILDPARDRLRAAMERRFDADQLPRSALLAARQGDVAAAHEAMRKQRRSTYFDDVIDVVLAQVVLRESAHDKAHWLLDHLDSKSGYLQPIVSALAAAGFEDAVRAKVDGRERELWMSDGLILAGRTKDALTLLDAIAANVDYADDVVARYAHLVTPEEYPRCLERFRSPEVSWSSILRALCRNGFVTYAVALVPVVDDDDWRELQKLAVADDIHPRALTTIALATMAPWLRDELFAGALVVAAKRDILDGIIGYARESIGIDGFLDLLAGVASHLEDEPEASAVVEVERGRSRDTDSLAYALLQMTGLGQLERALRLAVKADIEGLATVVPAVLAAIALREDLDTLFALAKETGQNWDNDLASAARGLAASGRTELASAIAENLDRTPTKWRVYSVASLLVRIGEIEKARALADKCEDMQERKGILSEAVDALIRRGSFDEAIETLLAGVAFRAEMIVHAARVFIEMGEGDRAMAFCKDLFEIRDLEHAATIGVDFLDAGDETRAREVLDLILQEISSRSDNWGASAVLEKACAHLATNGHVAMAVQLADLFNESNRCNRGLHGIIHALESHGDRAEAAQIAWMAFEKTLVHDTDWGPIVDPADVVRLGGWRAFPRVVERILATRDSQQAVEILARLAIALEPARKTTNLREWFARFVRRRRASALLRRAREMAEDFTGEDRREAMAALLIPLIGCGHPRKAARIADTLSTEQNAFYDDSRNRTIQIRAGRAFAAAGETGRARDIVRSLLVKSRDLSHRFVRQRIFRGIGILLSDIADDALCEEATEHIVALDSGIYATDCAVNVRRNPAAAAMFTRALRKHAQEFPYRSNLAEAMLMCGLATKDDETVDAALATLEGTDASERLHVLSIGALELSEAGSARARAWATAAQALAADREISVQSRARAHARLARAFHAIGDAAAAEEARWKTIDALRHLSRDDWFRVFEIAQPSFQVFGDGVMTDLYLAITDVETWSGA
jgi:tetratricopeptide (TPR) repeat protein